VDEHQWMALHLRCENHGMGPYSGFIAVDYALDRCQCNSVSFTTFLVNSQSTVRVYASVYSFDIIYVSP
jgi:hypothetical protein